MCFSYESQEYYLASLCKAFPVSARLNLNSAFLLGMLLCGDGRKVVPKTLSLKCMCFRWKEETVFSLKKDNLNIQAVKKICLVFNPLFLRVLAALEPKTDLT